MHLFSCTEIEEFKSVRPALITVRTALNLHRNRGYGQHKNRGYDPALNVVRFLHRNRGQFGVYGLHLLLYGWLRNRGVVHAQKSRQFATGQKSGLR